MAWRPALLGVVSLAKTQLDLTTQRGSERAQPGCGHVTAGSIAHLPPWTRMASDAALCVIDVPLAFGDE